MTITLETTRNGRLHLDSNDKIPMAEFMTQHGIEFSIEVTGLDPHAQHPSVAQYPYHYAYSVFCDGREFHDFCSATFYPALSAEIILNRLADRMLYIDNTAGFEDWKAETRGHLQPVGQYAYEVDCDRYHRLMKCFGNELFDLWIYGTEDTP